MKFGKWREWNISKVKKTETVFFSFCFIHFAFLRRKCGQCEQMRNVNEAAKFIHIMLWNHIDKHHLNQFVTKFFFSFSAGHQFRIEIQISNFQKDGKRKKERNRKKNKKKTCLFFNEFWIGSKWMKTKILHPNRLMIIMLKSICIDS